MLWIIGITVQATSLMVLLFYEFTLQNLNTPEELAKRKVEHRYTVSI